MEIKGRVLMAEDDIHLGDVMKDTLEEVGRSSDKLCVDIICIVLMIGFIAVLYNFIKN